MSLRMQFLVCGNPLHGFGGEFIQRLNALYEMLFFSVLDLVVRDAAQTLHEHHDGGHTGAYHLGSIMQRVLTGYSQYYNRKYKRVGHVFQGTHKSILCQSDQYLAELVRYIHLNPVRANIVAQPMDYRWSSHSAYAGQRAAEPWLTTGFALALFSEDRRRAYAGYRRFMECDSAFGLDGSLTAPEGPTSERTPAGRPPAALLAPLPRQTLAQLIEEACRHFGVEERHLSSASREPLLVQARAWIAREALERKISTLSAVARALGRDRATLRFGIQKRRASG